MRINEYGIILLFALLHSAVSVVARLVGFHELLILTLLTMYMSLVLSLHMKMNTPFILVAVVLISFEGMWIGEPIGVIARKYIFPPTPIRHYYVGPVCNFVTTWILGLIQVGCAGLFKKSKLYRPMDPKGFFWIILSIIIVLLVRLVMTMWPDYDSFQSNMILNVVLTCASCMVLILVMAWELMASMREEIFFQKRKRNEAKYSYERLKQQIEPHFLFNSLNSLASIVEGNENEKAVHFIHKLSDIYRYLTDNEQETVVPLNEEIRFVNQYIDLMKVRFPEGLETDMDINVENRYIIPCSLQLLVENCVKHNVISAEIPLRVHISVDGDYIQVSNNRNQKHTSIPSTGNGLRYIRKRYMDETGKNIILIDNDDEYTVKLPLI